MRDNSVLLERQPDAVHVCGHQPHDESPAFDSQYQTVLYNDNVNTTQHVITCLMRVFGHPFDLARKIMLEAHTTGRTIAQVEEYEQALLHKQQLVSAGLIAEVEKLS